MTVKAQATFGSVDHVYHLDTSSFHTARKPCFNVSLKQLYVLASCHLLSTHLSTQMLVALQVLSKTMDSTTLSPEKIELSTVRRDENNDEVHHTGLCSQTCILLIDFGIALSILLCIGTFQKQGYGLYNLIALV